MELLGLFADEQNGFRKGRSCIDHVYTLSTIIKNNVANRKNIYVAFVDMMKAFDWVDRDLMLYKLLYYNIDGKVYNAIRAMYSGTHSCVKLKQMTTDWFQTHYGVRQGDTLNPTL